MTVHYDFSRILRLVDQDYEMMENLIEIFNKQYPNCIDSIRTSILKNDLNQTVRDVHALKGSLSNICLQGAYETVIRMETAALQGDLSSVSDILNEIENEIPQLITDLNKYTQETCLPRS